MNPHIEGLISEKKAEKARVLPEKWFDKGAGVGWRPWARRGDRGRGAAAGLVRWFRGAAGIREKTHESSGPSVDPRRALR